MEADRLAEVREWLAGQDGDYAWMRRADVVELLEAVEWRDEDRWRPFTEQEHGLIAVALAALSIELSSGFITGTPADPATMARDLPVIVRLVSELSERTGTGAIDLDTRGALVAVLDQRAAEASADS